MPQNAMILPVPCTKRDGQKHRLTSRLATLTMREKPRSNKTKRRFQCHFPAQERGLVMARRGAPRWRPIPKAKRWSPRRADSATDCLDIASDGAMPPGATAQMMLDGRRRSSISQTSTSGLGLGHASITGRHDAIYARVRLPSKHTGAAYASRAD